jgi:hypothetical protein
LKLLSQAPSLIGKTKGKALVFMFSQHRSSLLNIGCELDGPDFCKRMQFKGIIHIIAK